MNNELEFIAKVYRDLYRKGKCSRIEAEKNINPYLDFVNLKGKEISKKYHKIYKNITFGYFVR